MAVHTTTFPAMGSTVTVVIDGPARLAGVARRRIEDLEDKWSRFRPASEISRINGARDAAVPVSGDTRLLVHRGIAAWWATGGAFDPSVHDSVVRWGYDRDLAGARGPATPTPVPAPGLDRVRVDDAAGTVRLAGAAFDPGGIGKGLAADLVATELVDAGADAALVGVGGDLRIAGDLPHPGWTVGVEDPLAPDRDLCSIALRGGGLATSSTRRGWPAAGRRVHHLFDPLTGAPARPSLAGVSVLAGEAWWAEALTKAVLVGGLDPAHLGEHDASGLGRATSGDVVGTPDLLEILGRAA